jgi:hypothetical protein
MANGARSMSQIALGFIPEPLVVTFEKLLPSKKLPENISVTKKES